jgi:hypothetical protein
MNYLIGLLVVVFCCLHSSFASELKEKFLERNDYTLGQALYHAAHKQHSTGEFTWSVISGRVLVKYFIFVYLVFYFDIYYPLFIF